MKRFEVFEYNKQNNSEMNCGPYDSTRHLVEFCISDDSLNDDVKDIWFSIYFDPDPSMSGEIDEINIRIEENRKTKILFQIRDINPKQLYWAGCAFKKIAKHFGYDRKTIEEEYNKKHKD